MSTVLIVDDCRTTCLVLAKLMTHLGYEGVSCLGGAAALEFLRTRRADLIILDLMMPVVDGTEVLRSIRTTPETADIPVVMFSAVSDAETIKRLLRLGANDYWVKSTLNYRELGELVARWVEASRQSDAA